MLKQQLVNSIIGVQRLPRNASGAAFAPANIALAKYWGKRQESLNLPVTNSLSISLGSKGTHTQIVLNPEPHDEVYLNGTIVAPETNFYQNLFSFLDLFRSKQMFFKVTTTANIPIGAGVASSASGFAALVQALMQLFGWQLSMSKLSILARLGSGSASRSLWPGFVEWQAGSKDDGLDSFAQPLPLAWPELRLGLLLFSTAPKAISSRAAMSATVKTCPFYPLWPANVATTITSIKAAIMAQDFNKFGEVVEANALAMHALMLATQPAVLYSTAETLNGMQQIWQARKAGLAVYFTQDAGPNLKLLFLQQDAAMVQALFPAMEIVNPWQPG